MKSTEEYAYGYAKGMVGMGIPDAIGLTIAIAEGDEEEAMFYAQMIGATHLTWYTAWKAVQQYDLLRHGAKNVKPINFHKVMFGVKHLITRAAGGLIVLAAAGSAIAQNLVWDKIGDPMTGSVHYARAGTMSGNRGPVVPATSPDQFRRDMERTLKNLGIDL